jgi:hypothetical protein
MKKILPLFIGLVVLNFQNIFAGAPENTKPQFQFTTFDVTQNSWDYALLHYNINDLATGEALEIPSFLINYEVKDKTGATVSKGSGLYVRIADTRLGSQEDYTLVVSTTINGQKISRSVCKKASPKQLAVKVNANGTDLDDITGNLSYSLTRTKFSNPTQAENIQIDLSDVSVAIALDNCSSCATYKIDAGPNHAKLADQAGYKNLQKDIKKMTKDGKDVQMTVEPMLVFKGETYKDTQSRYEVTAGGISEINTLDAVADK